jgi:hypothetical protein
MIAAPSGGVACKLAVGVAGARKNPAEKSATVGVKYRFGFICRSYLVTQSLPPGGLHDRECAYISQTNSKRDSFVVKEPSVYH